VTRTARFAAVAAVLAFSALPSRAQEDSSRLTDRARQDRDIVYFLQAPETHAFRLYHDYTESKEGADKYVNVVRKGSTASNPSAVLLDTGQALTVETLKGEEISKAKVDLGEPVRPDPPSVRESAAGRDRGAHPSSAPRAELEVIGGRR
jgi:hypothetical protein